MNALTTIPPTSCSCFSSPPFLSALPPWLSELHSKIWDREDLKPILFRKVRVTQAHYDALQDSLNRKYPNRDLAQYDGEGRHVLSDKLDILNWTTPTEALSPHHTNNNEDRADNDEEIKKGDSFEFESLFPFTLSFLDLSTLELKNTSDCFPSPLFIREEYNHISKLIDKYPQDGSGSVIVSGQPGTGEVLVSLSRSV